MVEALERLRQCFPDSFQNFDQEFVAHRRGAAVCDLRGCTSLLELQCRVIEQLSCHCCKTRPFKGVEANVSFRCFMMDGMGRFLGCAFTEEDYALVHAHLGNGVNRQLTIDWIRAGYNLELLRSRKREKLISADRLLEQLAGFRYQAKSLEQMRGGEDVLHRLVPKIIGKQAAIRVTQVGRCEDCGRWQTEDERAEEGFCLQYLCVKRMGGYCDEFRRREAKDGSGLDGGCN